MHAMHVHVLVALLLAGQAYGLRAVDNSGTEFILAFMDNPVYGSTDYDIEIYITTSSNNIVEVNVTTPLYDSSWSSVVNATRGNIVQVDVPAGIRGDGTALENKGVYITALEEVTVYCVNKQKYSTDAFIAYPTDSLGTEYLAITWDVKTIIMVASYTDGTSITFSISSDYSSSFDYGGSTYSGGDTLTITLDKYKTFHIYSASGDLTGTRITSTNPIAAFSGNQKTIVADTNTGTSSDHLVEQLVTTQAWGKEFVTVASPDRNVGDYFRVLAAEDSTTYTVGTSSTFSLNAQQYRDHSLNSDTYYWVASNKGISAAIFSKTIGSSGTNDGPNGGDPAMSIAVPVALYGSDYTWTTVTTAVGDFNSYIIVVSYSNWTSGLVLDNANVTATWISVDGNSDYVATYLNVTPGAHSIYNSVPAQSFLGMAYGNAQYNSYAYASGLRLASINLPCSATATVAADGLDNDCDGRIDEETDNGIDDDGDGAIDEDLAAYPRVNGEWGTWFAWTSCSATCGSNSGTYSRNRTCDNPAPANNGLDCVGDGTETASCTGSSSPCPINGEWGTWSAWTSCSATCGSNSGTYSRNRTCDNPAPANNGLDCVGDGTETASCTGSSSPCPINGEWGTWSAWTSCSATCGSNSGTYSRNRTCDNPAPANNGLDCVGDGTETASCTGSSSPCPINGEWGTWSAWTSCSATCGSNSGTYSRNRTCDNPAPANNGLDCVGDGTETASCTGSSSPCPIDGSWGGWGSLGTCSVTCGTGNQPRNRSCDTPAAQYGGADCVGSGTEYLSCNISDYCLPSFYGNLLLSCGNSSFGCATGTIQCIDIAFRCDGNNDCDDATDESQFFAGCAASVSKSAAGDLVASPLLALGAFLLLVLQQRK